VAHQKDPLLAYGTSLGPRACRWPIQPDEAHAATQHKRESSAPMKLQIAMSRMKLSHQHSLKFGR
jgi:hypothetical protein